MTEGMACLVIQNDRKHDPIDDLEHLYVNNLPSVIRGVLGENSIFRVQIEPWSSCLKWITQTN